MITPAQFGVFITTVNTMVGAAYSTTPVTYPQYTTTLPVSTPIWTAGWTGLMPKPRAWFGSRQPHEPNPQTYSVSVIPYENTYMMDRFHLDDDQYGIYYRLLPDMARQWKRHPEYELRDLLEGAGVQTGTRQNGFDGLSAFNTAHPVNLYDASMGTYCNDFSGGGQTIGGTLIGGALTPVGFGSLAEYVTTIKGEDGEPMGVHPTLMMVPATLRIEAELILKAAFFAPPAWGAYAPISGQVGAAENVLRRFGVDLLVNELLRLPTTWYLFDTSKAMQPLIWLEREPPVTVSRTAETDPVVFDQHKFVWGGWDRAAPAWCYSWLFFRSGPNGGE